MTTIWYMRDNHTFAQLPRDVAASIAILKAEFEAGHSYGMLCQKFAPIAHEHARGDFSEFAPRAARWINHVIEYKSSADLEYESWEKDEHL